MQKTLVSALATLPLVHGAVTSPWAGLVCEDAEQYNPLAYFSDFQMTCDEAAERLMKDFSGAEMCAPNTPLSNIVPNMPPSKIGEGVTIDNIYLGTVCCRDGRSLCESQDTLIVSKKGGRIGCDRSGSDMEGMVFDVFSNTQDCQVSYTNPLQKRHFIPALSDACASDYELLQTSWPLGPENGGVRIKLAHISKAGVSQADCQKHCDGDTPNYPRCEGIAWKADGQICNLLGQSTSVWGERKFYKDLGYVIDQDTRYEWVPTAQWQTSDENIDFVAIAREKDPFTCGTSWVKFDGCRFTIFEDENCEIPADTSNSYFGDDSSYYAYESNPFSFTPNTCFNRDASSSPNNDLSRRADDSFRFKGMVLSCCQGQSCAPAATLVASAFLSLLYLL